MVKFAPLPGIQYKHDYEAIFRDIASGKLQALETCRELCQKDLFFLLYFGLERIDVNRPYIIQCIKEVEEDHSDTLDLWHRESYKSTILSYALPIQELIKNPEERICIFSHTRPIAKSFLRQIKQTLEGDTIIKKWFKEIFYANPKSQANKWSEDDGLIVKRRSNAREASVEAWGLVDGQPIGKHFTIRIYDDVVTSDSVTTPEQIKKTLDAYELSQSLGTDGGTKRICGTHYHFADLYTVLKKKDNYKTRIKPATDDGTPTGKPVFLSEKRLAELLKEQGPYIFASQQLLNPVATEDQKFQSKWLKYYDALPAYLNKYLLVDPANEKNKKSDYTVMAVIGLDAFDNFFLLDILRDRLDLGQRWTAMRDMYQRNPDIQDVGYEKYGKDADITYMEMMQAKEGVYFNITPLGGRTGKWDRIYRLVPLFKNGKFYLPRRLFYKQAAGAELDLVKVFIDEEYLTAPFCAHDDMFDTIARIEDEALNVTRPIARTDSLIPVSESASASGWMGR